MRLYFARHGESEANILRVISNREVAHRLTPNGREQAEALAESLKSADIVQIYSSPICRAWETAEIVSHLIGAPLAPGNGLREFDCGILEGRGDAEAWERHLWVQKRWHDAGDLAARIEGGESFVEIETRFRQTLGNTQQPPQAQGNKGQDGAILYISHGATLLAMLPVVLTNLSRDVMLDRGLKYTTLIEVVSSDGILSCVSWDGIEFHS